MLKIDVDGYDGEVLSGGIETLRRCKPAVIFEWHPKLVSDCGNDPVRGFDALRAAGYGELLWFTNTGTFSHFTEDVSERIVKLACSYLLAVNRRADDHFDIIALPPGHSLDAVSIATLARSTGC